MNAVLSSVSEAFVFLLQSFRLAFVLPTFVFVCLNAYLVFPSLPQEGIIERFSQADLASQVTVLLAISFLLGYFLAIINIWVIRLFEGYQWMDDWLGRKMVASKRKHRQSLIAYKTELERRNKTSARTRQPTLIKDEIKAIEKENDRITNIDLVSIELYLQESYPKLNMPFLPTSFGNAIAAFEEYSFYRYGIDAVAIWPRFLPTLTEKKYAAYLEQSKASLDFIINLSFLALVFGAEEVFHVFCETSPDEALSRMVVVIIAFLIAVSLYKFSIIGIRNWGTAVKVAFDLYRFDLLKALNGKMPLSSSEERRIWGIISQFIKEGGFPEDIEPLINRESPVDEAFDYQRINVATTPESKGDKADV